MATKKAPKRSRISKGGAPTRPVRVDFSDADHERLQGLAQARGLSKAAYARQAVLAAMKADEQAAG
jgi:hypothetical protein